MLLDNECLFCDNQAITTGTAVSQNVIRFGEGDISYLPLLIQVTEAFAGLTSLTVSVQTADNESFTNATTLVESTLALAALKEGEKFPINYLPKGNKGYMRLSFTVVGTATKGKITAGIVCAHDIGYSA